ncbi:MAG: hypothetical protein K6T55_08080 [Syntrophobacterales bacterium]|nr:hypothetical protein [Syntrophobacterales bacterium]
MLKRWLSRLVRDRGLHKISVRVDFYAGNLAVPAVYWYNSQDQEGDTVLLALYLYARILFELAEQNETRVAKELMEFLDQVKGLVLTGEGPPKRPRLPLGAVSLGPAPATAPERRYQADFYQMQDGSYRLNFQGSVGKEGFYLPAAFLVFFQTCLDRLGDDALTRLIHCLGRLHDYYRYRRDFWDSTSLTAGPAFALGREEIRPEEPGEE